MAGHLITDGLNVKYTTQRKVSTYLNGCYDQSRLGYKRFMYWEYRLNEQETTYVYMFRVVHDNVKNPSFERYRNIGTCRWV